MKTKHFVGGFWGKMSATLALWLMTGFWAMTAHGQHLREFSGGVAIIERTNSQFTIENTYPSKLESTARNAALDRFGRQSEIRWIRAFDEHGYDAISEQNRSGRDLMARAMLNGARETASGWSVAGEWQEWAEDLYTGTIGNTTEEKLNTGSVAPSASEESWWQNWMKPDNMLSYGFRPINGQPYAYANVSLGHWENKPLFVLHSRVYYKPFDHMRFNEVRMDVNALMVLDSYCTISAGISFNPITLGENGSYTTASVRLSHGVFESNDASVEGRAQAAWIRTLAFFGGFNVGQRSGSFQCGLTMKW